MSQFDHYGRALRENWRDKRDLTPFTATLPAVDMVETPEKRLHLRVADAIDDEAFNRVLWAVEKGAIPYPGARQADALTLGLGSR